MNWRPPGGVLGELVAGAREDSAQRMRRRPRLEPPRRSRAGRFRAALEDPTRSDFPLICEVKRSSPSEGEIRGDAEIEEFVRTYVAAGARCVSVLTEGRRFGGSVEDLRTARSVTSAPLLRKDFVVHPYMIDEAADAGADCVLLIAAAVEPTELLELAWAADKAGLEVLLELVFERDLTVLPLRDWPLVGINSRNLETLEMDPSRFAALAPLAQQRGRLLVAESGIRTAADVRRVRQQGASAALVGEALMRSQDPASLIRELSRAGGQE